MTPGIQVVLLGMAPPRVPWHSTPWALSTPAVAYSFPPWPCSLLDATPGTEGQTLAKTDLVPGTQPPRRAASSGHTRRLCQLCAGAVEATSWDTPARCGKSNRNVTKAGKEKSASGGRTHGSEGGCKAGSSTRFLKQPVGLAGLTVPAGRRRE